MAHRQGALEGLGPLGMTPASAVDRDFWRGRKVFLTGHTGFKGSWMCLWLHGMGAEVTGYALPPPTEPSLFVLCGIGRLVRSVTADVRDPSSLRDALRSSGAEIVIHMAAQPIVRESYKVPVETFDVNVMGTVHLLESVRACASVRAVVNVTTDKCYENREWIWGYRENDPMGGSDPYSASKACSEIVTAAYRNSYFHPSEHTRHGVAVASARAGNVIGGGDWAPDRLLPDCVRFLLRDEAIPVRNPAAVRPWQHVLEPLCGYLLLAQRLVEEGPAYAEGWNFGPSDEDALPVEWLVRTFCAEWGGRAAYVVDKGPHPPESRYLKLDCSKARQRLGWVPRWNLACALRKVVEWTRTYAGGGDVRAVCLRQIADYENEPTPAPH